MTVGELRAELAKLPADLPVLVPSEYDMSGTAELLYVDYLKDGSYVMLGER